MKIPVPFGRKYKYWTLQLWLQILIHTHKTQKIVKIVESAWRTLRATYLLHRQSPRQPKSQKIFTIFFVLCSLLIPDAEGKVGLSPFRCCRRRPRLSPGGGWLTRAAKAPPQARSIPFSSLDCMPPSYSSGRPWMNSNVIKYVGFSFRQFVRSSPANRCRLRSSSLWPSCTPPGPASRRSQWTPVAKVARCVNMKSCILYQVDGVDLMSVIILQPGAATCFEGFVIYVFWKPPWCLGSMASAVQPNGLWNLQKRFYKQVSAPVSI